MSRRFTPRHNYRHTVIALTGFLVMALGACQNSEVSLPPVTSELSDSSWPAVDEHFDPDLVHDAAHALITRYLATTDAITADGGEGPGKMAQLTTPAWFPTEEAAFAHYRSQKLRTIGDTVFDSLVIQSVAWSVAGVLNVDAIVCVDASWVWLVPHDAPDPPEGLTEWLRSGDDDLDISEEDYDLWSDYLDAVQPIPGEREAIVVWLVGDNLGTLLVDGTINWEGADACHATATID